MGKIKGADGKACWDGYRYNGTENGKDKCIKVEMIEEMSICTECAIAMMEDIKAGKFDVITEAEYQGRKINLGKPFLTPGGPKKRSVYVKNAKGNVVKVNFGDPNMRIKKNIPARRKSFRARHKCATATDRTSARYWSCKAW